MNFNQIINKIHQYFIEHLHEEDNSIAFEYRINSSKPLIETTTTYLYRAFNKNELLRIFNKILTEDESKFLIKTFKDKQLNIKASLPLLLPKEIIDNHLKSNFKIITNINDLDQYIIPDKIIKYYKFLNYTDRNITHIISELTDLQKEKLIQANKQQLINWLYKHNLFDNFIKNFSKSDLKETKDKTIILQLTDTDKLQILNKYLPEDIFNPFKECIKNYDKIIDLLSLKLNIGESTPISGGLLHQISHDKSFFPAIYVNGNVIDDQSVMSNGISRQIHQNLINKYNYNWDLHKDDKVKYSQEEWKQIIKLPFLEYRNKTHLTSIVINKNYGYGVILNGGNYTNEVAQAVFNKYNKPLFALDDSASNLTRKAKRLLHKILIH